ncbi:MAG: AzlC family ABC transporter permease [Deltaproteobacteria bacterium]|nr:AzlC family ABC transporter permease [Deltaproteobacteria bacterium]MBW2594368.1 AzlC family ABC transporter permease [Deltaproteobacteria bacterium]MBW2649861.1 AzlC family ABC transporter permease [Deltaproteobacteria bacterium]
MKSEERTADWTAIIKDGVIGAWPICLGYLAIGLAFGVIAQKAGFHPVEIGLMSLLVYAGSSQFIAVSMLSAGAGIVPIVITTFTVNLRHMLMSSSLSTFMRNLGIGRLSLFAYGVTDESFALNSAKFRDGKWDWRRALVLNHATNLTWIASTVAGGFGGQFIPAGALGIDYALSAMFICLLVFQLRGRLYVIVAIIAGILAVALSLLLPGNTYIVAASVIAATLGVFLKRSKLFAWAEQKS